MVSTLSGPIPPHPYYDKSDPQAYLKLAPPRVRPEAEEIARQGRGTLSLELELEGHKVFPTHTKTSLHLFFSFLNYSELFMISGVE